MSVLEQLFGYFTLTKKFVEVCGKAKGLEKVLSFNQFAGDQLYVFPLTPAPPLLTPLLRCDLTDPATVSSVNLGCIF